MFAPGDARPYRHEGFWRYAGQAENGTRSDWVKGKSVRGRFFPGIEEPTAGAAERSRADSQRVFLGAPFFNSKPIFGFVR
jgi:hypothetical protein